MLMFRNITLSKADTTGQILDKSHNIKGAASHLCGITRLYDSVRYGEHVPDTVEMDTLRKDSVSLLELLRHKKSN